MTNPKNITIIGAGPGGYVCAIKLAQLGHSVTIIEKQTRPGGTCLNVGCIPSKNLLNISQNYYWQQNYGAKAGLMGTITPDFNIIHEQKNQTLDELGNGIKYLFKKNGIKLINGEAEIINANAEIVAVKVNEETITSDVLILATGSNVRTLPNLPIDEINILSSTGALDITSPPASMVVIGAGYIGLEMGCVWQRFGTKITVIEAGKRVLPNMDTEIATALQTELTKQGIHFMLNTTVKEATITGTGVTLTLEETLSDGSTNCTQIECSKVLVAIGRIPNTNIKGLENLNINLNKNGTIDVNSCFATNVKNVYAIGDVISGPMLAHKAEAEGLALAAILSGKDKSVNYNLIPGVIYTTPEVASVGFSEDQLDNAAIPYDKAAFPFKANSRAKATHDTIGFVKLLAHKDTGVLLGAHIISKYASTMITHLTQVMQQHGTVKDLISICYPHPTYNEAIKEAALMIDSKAIHF